ITIISNVLALLNSDREKNNLLVWKSLFLDTDSNERDDKNVENKCSESIIHPMHIIGGLSSSAFFMKAINDVFTSPSMLNSTKREVISSYLPNDVNPRYQRTSTSSSIINDSHTNHGTRLGD
ncbi:unnamed protein product, partial [Didymodactylos carnosus]